MKRLVRFLILPALLSACAFSATSCDNSSDVDFIDVWRVSFNVGLGGNYPSYRITTITDNVQITATEYAELDVYEYGIYHYNIATLFLEQQYYRADKTVAHNVPKGATIKYGTYISNDYNGERETTYYRAKVQSTTDYFAQVKFDGNTATFKYYDDTKNELVGTSTDWTVIKQNGKITRIENNQCTIDYFLE
ncbi:MAG: hypothetical protein LBR37_01365 [Erysipelotrichaceae bacterium]|jgi:hypothetical protein|nr:hypothetical protein [Erysipelotrichaceae bacterium]